MMVFLDSVPQLLVGQPSSSSTSKQKKTKQNKTKQKKTKKKYKNLLIHCFKILPNYATHCNIFDLTALKSVANCNTNNRNEVCRQI